MQKLSEVLGNTIEAIRENEDPIYSEDKERVEKLLADMEGYKKLFEFRETVDGLKKGTITADEVVAMNEGKE